MSELTKENLKALENLLELPIVKQSKKGGVIVNCGGCTSLHHNN